MKRRGGANALVVSELIEESRREREEQNAAQIAALSCEVSMASLRIGVRNTIISLKAKPKTKYEYNKERKRDFRVNKAAKEEKTPLDLTADDLERRGKVSYHLLHTDPPAYFRDYHHSVFESTMKLIHHSFPSFKHIQSLQLGEQLLGDDRLDRLCEALQRNQSVTAINLSGNALTDIGLGHLARIQRSLPALAQLNLSWNDFTDQGIAMLLHEDKYSGSLQELDLSNNILTAATAYHIGLMFKGRSSCLHTLRLGGTAGRRGWGDAFLQVLVHGLLLGDMSRLRALHVPDFSLTADGLESLISLLACDALQLKVLNISKNPITVPSTRQVLLQVLTVLPHPPLVHAVDCCFTHGERQYLSYLSNTLYMPDEPVQRMVLGRPQRLSVCHAALHGLNGCAHMYRTVKQEVLNIWRLEQPLTWKTFVQDYPSDLLSNLTAVLGKGMDILFTSAADKDLLLRANRCFGEVYSLQDSLHALQGSAVNDGGNAMHKTTHSSPQITAVKQRMAQAQMALDALTVTYSARQVTWGVAADTLVHICEQFHKAYAGNAKKWRLPQLSPQDAEQLAFALEDAQSLSVDFSDTMQHMIARYYELKLLRMALVQLALNQSVGIGFADILRKVLPCFETLGPMAFFTYYAYLEQHKAEGNDMNALKQRMQALPG